MNALALLEFDSIARGVLAVDRMLKQAPIALLRCGTIHPGRYLALCGGSVASTEEAHRAGCAAGDPCGSVLLPDPHPGLVAALSGEAAPPPAQRDLLVLETASSPPLVRLLDSVLKTVPLSLHVLRLADDLGGHAYAVLAGELADIEAARELASAGAALATVIARPDAQLRAALAGATRFARCPLRPLARGEPAMEK